MDSLTSLRPFTKIVDVMNAASSITLTDTTGTLINCNYCKIYVTSSTAGGYVSIAPSGIASATNALGNGASGTLAVIATVNEPGLLTINPNYMKAVTVTPKTGATVGIALVYGVLKADSAIKGLIRDPGV